MEKDNIYDKIEMQDTKLSQTNKKSPKKDAAQHGNRHLLVTLIIICSLVAGMLTYITYIVTTQSDCQKCHQEQKTRPDICSGETDPCSGHGRCLVTETSYRCECYDGWTGPGCHTTIKFCVSNPCVNGGLCDDVTNGYTCQCQDGYTGVHCETDINECANVPCVNGGTCQDVINGYSCQCPTKYHGAHCEKGNPDWETDWIEMTSQSLSDSYRVVVHHLDEVPIKVKVLVKPTSGPNADFVFEASSQQEGDDDRQQAYCGVVYFYDHQQVYIRVPMKNNNFASGFSFCTGNGWSDGYSTHEQNSSSVLVKVVAWKRSSFPDPQLITPWTYIGEGQTFVEIPYCTDTKPMYVHLQFRCNKTSNFLYGEGTSRASEASGYDSNGGIVYAVSSNLIRIWIHGKINEGGKQALSAYDGYGPVAQSDGCKSGQFRVYGWTSLGSLLYDHSLTLSTETIQNTELLKVLTTIPLRSVHQHNFITVQVTPLSGRNTGFTFTSVGQIQRTARGVRYGGLAFGYSDTELRLYVPVGGLGSVSIVDNVWGDGRFAEYTNNTRIDVRIWEF